MGHGPWVRQLTYLWVVSLARAAGRVEVGNLGVLRYSETCNALYRFRDSI